MQKNCGWILMCIWGKLISGRDLIYNSKKSDLINLVRTGDSPIGSWTSPCFTSTLLKCTRTAADTQTHTLSGLKDFLVCQTWCLREYKQWAAAGLVYLVGVEVSGVRQEESKQWKPVRSVMTMIFSQSFSSNPGIKPAAHNDLLCLSERSSLRSMTTHTHIDNGRNGHVSPVCLTGKHTWNHVPSQWFHLHKFFRWINWFPHESCRQIDIKTIDTKDKGQCVQIVKSFSAKWFVILLFCRKLSWLKG